MGLEDRYELPDLPDSYAALCWWAWPDRPLQARQAGPSENYPYLTWEARASQADYEALRGLASDYPRLKLSPPHTWHAAEMFLYLLK